MQATFLSLKRGEEYTLTIKTLVNGQSVGQIREKFNTDKLKKLQVKELSEEKDNKMEEKETLAPQEEREEVKVKDEGTYLEDIAEENEEVNQMITEKEPDAHLPIDIFGIQKLSKRMRDQNKKRVSLEVIDEKARDSASQEKVKTNRSTHFEIACVVL